MLNLSRKYFQIFCFLLTIHIVALNSCEKFYLDFISQTTISKDYDIEEESDSKIDSDKIDGLVDDYIVAELPFEKHNLDISFIEKNAQISSNQLLITLSQGNYEIQIPPPRA